MAMTEPGPPTKRFIVIFMLRHMQIPSYLEGNAPALPCARRAGARLGLPFAQAFLLPAIMHLTVHAQFSGHFLNGSAIHYYHSSGLFFEFRSVSSSCDLMILPVREPHVYFS